MLEVWIVLCQAWIGLGNDGINKLISITDLDSLYRTRPGFYQLDEHFHSGCDCCYHKANSNLKKQVWNPIRLTTAQRITLLSDWEHILTQLLLYKRSVKVHAGKASSPNTLQNIHSNASTPEIASNYGDQAWKRRLSISNVWCGSLAFSARSLDIIISEREYMYLT